MGKASVRAAKGEERKRGGKIDFQVDSVGKSNILLQAVVAGGTAGSDRKIIKEEREPPIWTRQGTEGTKLQSKKTNSRKS